MTGKINDTLLELDLETYMQWILSKFSWIKLSPFSVIVR